MPLNLNFTNEGFDNIVLRNEKNILHLRTNAFDDEEAWRWKEVFTKHNNITFNVLRLYHGVRYTFHQKFMCLHGDKRHKGVKKTYTGCSVKMNIKIKLITKATCRTDKNVEKHPCIIRIEGVHNHPTEAASALQELRIPTETIDTFSKYFDLGMTVPQAMRFHQEKLNFNLSDLANAALNPKSKSVYYIREKWLKNNHGSLGGIKLRRAKIKLLHDSLCEVSDQYGDEQSTGAIERLINKVCNVRSSNQFNSLLQCFGAALPCVGRGKIPCQPTSIARRQQGMPRGAAPITKGRKRKGNLIHKRLKRQRNLALNISLNQMNGKSHGSGH